MAPFVFIYILLFILFILSKPRYNNLSIIFLMTMIMVLFCGLREPSLYPDMGGYQYFFKNGVYPEYISELKGDDIGYAFLNKIIRGLSGSFQFFCFIVSGLMVSLYSWFSRKYSPYPTYSLLLFAIIAYLFQFFIIRQCLAAAIGMLAFHFTLRKKPILFVASVLLATSIHTTGILLAPIYPIFYFFKEENKWIWFLYIATGVFTLAFNFIANWLFSSYEYYAHYLESDSEFSFARTAMKVYILLLYLCVLKKDAYKKDIRFLVLLCLLFNVIIYAGCGGIYGAYRMRFFFEISEIIGIPLIVKYSKQPGIKNRQVIGILTYIYVFALCWSAYSFLTSEHMSGGYHLFHF